jgi:hypothetical protein
LFRITGVQSKKKMWIDVKSFESLWRWFLRKINQARFSQNDFNQSKKGNNLNKAQDKVISHSSRMYSQRVCRAVLLQQITNRAAYVSRWPEASLIVPWNCDFFQLSWWSVQGWWTLKNHLGRQLTIMVYRRQWANVRRDLPSWLNSPDWRDNTFVRWAEENLWAPKLDAKDGWYDAWIPQRWFPNPAMSINLELPAELVVSPQGYPSRDKV